jgi:hypothetical protein
MPELGEKRIKVGSASSLDMSGSGGNKVNIKHVAESIIMIAAVLTALGVIGGVILKFYHLIMSIKDKLDTMDKHQTETYIATLRLTIMSEEMPLEERIAAGDKYIAAGGNGAVKHKYEQLLELLDKNKNGGKSA